MFKHRDVQLLITVAEMLGHNLDRKQRQISLQHSNSIFTTPVSSINQKLSINIQHCDKILMKWMKKENKVCKLRCELQLFHGSIPLCGPVSTPLRSTTCINRECPNGPLLTVVRRSSSSSSNRQMHQEQNSSSTKEEEENNREENMYRLPDGLKLIKKPGAYDYDFNQTLELNFRIKNIPAAALLCLTLWEGKGKSSKPRGWAGMRLFGYDRSMVNGEHTLKLCPYTVSVNPSSTTIDGSRLRKQVVSTVQISFDNDLPKDIRYNDDTPLEDLELEGLATEENNHYYSGSSGSSGSTTATSGSTTATSSTTSTTTSSHHHNDLKPTLEEYNTVRSRLSQLAGKDPLYRLTREDKNLLWRYREWIMHNDTLLPKLLRSINWGNRAMVQEGYRVMYAWEQPRPIVALTMLNDHFPDPKVRGYASLCLERMRDETLSQYILQLTQTLKHEPFHDSGLARFLLRRAIRNTRLLGHQLFWSLKAEMHDPLVSDRYGVLLDMYRRNCGAHRGELGHQLFLMRQLQNCSDIVKPLKDKEKRKKMLKERLDYVNQQLRDVDVFQLPLDPHMVSTGIVVEESRVMGSKQAPIWLVFENAVDPQHPHVVMFKAGDDLRQDQLTLQVIHVMDTLWQAEGFDFCINDYKCVRYECSHSFTKYHFSFAVIIIITITAILVPLLYFYNYYNITVTITYTHTIIHNYYTQNTLTGVYLFSTGWEQGMIEIVQNASTVATIIAKGAEKRTGYTGKKLARRAAADAMWRKHSISDWLLEQSSKFDPRMWNGQYGTRREFFGGSGTQVRRSWNRDNGNTSGSSGGGGGGGGKGHSRSVGSEGNVLSTSEKNRFSKAYSFSTEEKTQEQEETEEMQRLSRHSSMHTMGR